MERVIRADFSAWSGGSERLTMRQVGHLERMSEITGQQAAVLGLIGQFMVHQIKNDQGHEPAFNLEELLERLQALPQMRVHFLTAMKELTADTTFENKLSLYGQVGRPSMDGIHQAGIGDCFALSAIESVLNCRGPGFIESLIQETGYNQFLVSLPGAEPLTIKLTQAEIAQGNVDPGNGCWLQLLGIAIDRLKAEHRHASRSKVKRIKDHQLTETPLEVLAVGGSQPMVFHWLTNDRYTLVRHRSETWNQNYVAGILNRAALQKIPLGVNTPEHCLSILGWNPDTQIVTVMNPWGTSGSYAPNGTEKFKMNDGVFSLSLDQLLQFFSSLSVPVQLCGANG